MPCDLAIISPNDPAAMVQYAAECRTLGIPYIFDPSQQVARLSGDELRQGVSGAEILICNDYEFEIIREKTGMDEGAMLANARAVVVTKGEKGASIIQPRRHHRRAGRAARSGSSIRPASATRSAAAS